MEQQRPIRGAVPVLVMPFDEDGAVDEGSLVRQIDFCLEAGVEAIAFAVGSESAMLTDAERIAVWSLAVRHVDGRARVIAATTHASREGVLALTRAAVGCGVDCAMVNPQPRQGESLVAFFRDLSERVDIPLMLQDAGGNAPVADLLRAAQEAKRICSFKIESQGAPDKIRRVVAGLREQGALERSNVTVLGGSNGHLLPEELEQGSAGTLPYPPLIDAYQRVCDLFFQGEAEAARTYFMETLHPLMRLTASAPGTGDRSMWLSKAILHRAGILRSTRARAEVSPLQEWILEKVWRHLESAGLTISRRLQSGRRPA